MEHGEIEKKCFDYVKQELLTRNSICYACSVENEEIIKNAYNTAIPNPVWNKFPDFLFDNGFIEHFEVTSSHSNRNGSTMRRELDKLNEDISSKEKAMMSEMNETPCYEGKTITANSWHSKHTYEDFCLSFKKSFEKHIDKFNKFSGNKEISIFMIQYNDSALVMNNDLSYLKTGIIYGDLIQEKNYNGYRLTHDGNMLEYIYQFKDKIHYVAFYNNDCFHGKLCEIICVENIPEILKIVKGKYHFHCATIGTSHIIQGISVPNHLSKGNKEDEQT